MKKRILGKTGYSVSSIAYGGIISASELQKSSDHYVSWAVEQGINYFDIAPSYWDGEQKLGPSLKPYRKGIYLACKTGQRLRSDAEKEFHRSLELLQTDYFDNYQIHSISKMEEVEQAFGPGGVMEFLQEAKEKGLVRKLGITSHCEDVALECLKRYDFDTVMFPINWHLHLTQGIGERLNRVVKEKNIGFLGIKSLIQRAWHSEEERHSSAYPKSWCKPIGESEEAFGLAAMKYALSLGPDVLIPPGNFASFKFEAGHIDECLKNPLNNDDRNLLKAELEKVPGETFFTVQGEMAYF